MHSDLLRKTYFVKADDLDSATNLVISFLKPFLKSLEESMDNPNIDLKFKEIKEDVFDPYDYIRN